MDIVNRILISSLAEAPALIRQGRVGAVISAVSPWDYDSKPDGRAFLQAVRDTNTRHCNSFIFNIDHKMIELMNAPAAVREPHVYAEVERTLNIATDMVKTAGERRLLFHCAEGLDRSPMLALVFMNAHMGGPKHIVKSLQALHTLRPQARLETHADPFIAHFGEDYADVEKKITTYRATFSDIARLKHEVENRERFGALPFNELKRRISRHNHRARVFGMERLAAPSA